MERPWWNLFSSPRDFKHSVLIGSLGVGKCFLLLGLFWSASQRSRLGLQRGFLTG